MRLEGYRSGILLSPVFKERFDIAVVVDLYSLLCGRRVIPRWARLKYEAVNGGED
jgi:hypothetical protein